MATPSAILSVLLSTDDTLATGKLTAYSRKLDEVNLQAKKGISARLGGTFNDEAFRKYQVATDAAARKAADQRAFKAELGANYSPTGFRAYQKAITQAGADTAAVDAKTGKFSGALSALGGAAKTAAVAVVGIGASAAVVGAESVRAAASFQQAMEIIHTQAHASQQQVDALSKSVLALAPAVGTGPDALADGLYHLISQGLTPGVKAMNALRVAAEGAKIGNADLVDVTNALGAAVSSGVKGTSNLTAAMASMNATVGAGDMHMQDLAEAFGTGILGPMKQFGVNLQDIDAALAVFGDNNIRGADAGTKLSSAIRIMAAPSKAAAAALATIGLGATTLADEIRSGPGGLLTALEDLQKKLQDSGETASQQARTITAAFGGRQSTGVELLLGQLSKLQSKEEAVGGGALNLGDAWTATQHNLSFQLDTLKTTFETLGIAIGNALAPVVPVLVGWSRALTKFVGQMETGKGAGGKFASGIKTAFGDVKTAIGDVEDAFGGLKGTLEVIAGGYAVAKILKLAGALGGLAKGASAIGPAAGAASAAGGAGVATTGLLGKLGGALSKASWLAYLAPVGIALGAVVGNWIKTSAEAEGKKFANQFLAPMPDAIKEHFEKPISDAVNRVAAVQRNQRTTKTISSLGTRASGLSTDAATHALSASATANAAIIQAQYFKLGQAAGQAAAAGLKGVKDISEPIVLQDFLSRLKDLPAQARPEAAKAMISFASELQAQGKLPVKAVQDIMRSLEAQIPGFAYYLQQQGLSSDQAFAKALRFTTASSTLTRTLATYRQQFGDWSIATKITGNNIVQNMTVAMEHLHQTVKDSTGETRKDAIDELQKLHDQATQLFSSMASKTAQAAKDMQGSITSSTSQAAKDAAANLSGVASAVYGGLRSGAINAKQGSEYIQKALNATLKAFGATPIPSATLAEVALSTPFSAQVGAFTKAGVGGGGKPAGAARGGLMQIGSPGQAGRDSVPLNVGGMPVMVAPGEQVAVFNRHQLPIVNQALAPMGGLPGLFSKVNKPNYMAGGGLVPGFASGGVVSYSGLEGLWDQAGGPANMAALMAAIAEAESGGSIDAFNPSGASGLWQILGSIVPGNLFDPMVNAQNAVAKWRSQGLGAWMTYTSGAYKQFLQGGVPAGAAGGSAAGAVAALIAAPKVKGGGTIGTLLTAAFGKEADAANAYASKVTASLGGGAGGATPSFPVASGPFPRPVQVALGAARALLGRPYILGGYGMSAPGLDCSGYVSTVLNAAGLIGGHEVTDQLKGWGASGPGKYITVGVRGVGAPGHTMMEIAGQFFESGGGGPFGAGSVHQDPGWDGVFTTIRHPPGFAKGGMPLFNYGERPARELGPLPFAGSFDKGGVVPGAKGMPSVAIVHGGERIHAASGLLADQQQAAGSTLSGGLSSTFAKYITPAERKTFDKVQKQIVAAAIAAVVKQLGSIPSQGVGGQIALQGLQNQYTLAQNAGNTGGQASADQKILALENTWLTADKGQLKKVNKQLAKRGLSKKARAGLLQDKLALLQEIGTIEGDIGSTQADLTSLTTATADTSGTDTGDTSATDATSALTDATQAQTDAINALNATLQTQLTYMKSVGAVETSQAIKALSDVISGQIGGLAYSRQTGSAGDGTVVRY